MEDNETKRGPGQPPIEITEEQEKQIVQMIEWGATQQEVADALGIHVKTLQNRFHDLFLQGMGKFKISVRRQQHRMLMSDNVTMAIWLGKQYLGQRDFKDDGAATKQDVQAVTDAIRSVLPTVNFNPSVPPEQK